MTTIVFTEEWVVALRLKEKTGLTDRQIKGYRQTRWVEGVHFKRVPLSDVDSEDRGLVWYNFPKINSYVEEA